MSEEKILTEHPGGKRGVRIDRARYEVMKKAIVESLHEGEMTHTELMKAVEGRLKGKFQGLILWYAETVKIDLEAKKVIERIHDA